MSDMDFSAPIETTAQSHAGNTSSTTWDPFGGPGGQTAGGGAAEGVQQSFGSPWPDQATQGQPFGDYPPDQVVPVQLPPGKPPLVLLVLPVVFVLISGGVALWTSSLPILIGCWALAGPVAVVVLGQFITRDQAARARPTYLGASWVKAAPLVVGALIVVGIGLTAFGIGRWVALA